MKQSLLRLPETADIRMSPYDIQISDHQITCGHLFNTMLWMTNCHSCEEVQAEMEKNGISFEILVECCVQEMECYPLVLREIIRCRYHNNMIGFEQMVQFSKSTTGRKIADILERKIRECDSVREIRDIFDEQSKFHNIMKNSIECEIKSYADGLQRADMKER